jgi:cysteine desulfurase
MNRDIYLDNSATTQVLPEVVAIATEMMTKTYGNPSSLHKMGLAAAQVVRQARQAIAEILGAKSEEICFCSGGTEANNMAIQGRINKKAGKPNHLITSQVEHPSVLKTCQILKQQGTQVTFLPVNQLGIIDPADVAKAITPDTSLVSLMHVNNETGAIQPILEVAEILRRHPQVVFHVDGVQSFARLPLEISRSGIHLFSMSSHKIHGPKGVGALYVRAGTRLAPLFWGGEQEANLRAGTENVPGIAAFATAATLAARHRPEFLQATEEFRDSFLATILARLDKIKLNSPIDKRGAPHILNLSFEGIKAEVLVRMLHDRRVFVSTGAACHSRRNQKSHVLLAMGLPAKHLEGAIRFSFSLLNTKEEIPVAAEAVAAAVAELRSV